MQPQMQPQMQQPPDPRMQLLLLQRAGVSPEVAKMFVDPMLGKKAPTTLASGAELRDANDPTKVIARNEKPQEGSALAKLMSEAAKLPPNDPARKIYEQMIQKTVTHQPATQVSVDARTQKSLAERVGPIMEKNRVVAEGAQSMYQSADQLENALNSGMVITGPGADVKTKALQIGKVLGVTGKTSDEMLVNTRSAIKSLAEMGVQARKELSGQGAITESEAAAVQKAYSGDLSQLTDNELRMLTQVTKRAASMRAKGYQSQLQSIDPESRQFYQIPGLDTVAGHKERPTGTPSIDDLMKKYGSR